MDSCQNNLLKACFGQVLYLLLYRFFLSASHSSSRIGNHTVGAELIAAILYLNIGAGMVFHLCDWHILVFGRVIYIYHCICLFLLGLKFLQNLDNIFFSVISYYNINRLVCLTYFLRSLHIAARRHHNGIWIPFFCPMQHLAGLSIRNIGDSTVVDNIAISLFRKWTDRIAALSQPLLHRLCLICIYLAAQIM